MTRHAISTARPHLGGQTHPARTKCADARLLQLSRQLRDLETIRGQLCGREGPEAAWDAFERAWNAVAEEVIATRAETVAGMRVKAQAVATIYEGERISLAAPETTDIRLVQSILRDLLAA